MKSENQNERTDSPLKLFIGFNEDYVNHLEVSHDCVITPIRTAADIAKNSEACNSRYFSEETMSAWGSTLHNELWGHRYFMTSEKYEIDEVERIYVIRSAHLLSVTDEDTPEPTDYIQIKTIALFESRDDAVQLGRLLGHGISLEVSLSVMRKPISQDVLIFPPLYRTNQHH
jgi:hypothetical protein